MTKPLDYLRSRPVPVLALALAMRTVLERKHGVLPAKPKRKRREPKQGTLNLEGMS